MSQADTTLAIEAIARRIAILRDQRVILDADLAALSGVPARRLNEQVRRNRQRFPADFKFHLVAGEWEPLRSQIATLKTRVLRVVNYRCEWPVRHLCAF